MGLQDGVDHGRDIEHDRYGLGPYVLQQVELE